LFKEDKLRLPHEAISLSYILLPYEFNVMHPAVLLTMTST